MRNCAVVASAAREAGIRIEAMLLRGKTGANSYQTHFSATISDCLLIARTSSRRNFDNLPVISFTRVAMKTFASPLSASTWCR